MKIRLTKQITGSIGIFQADTVQDFDDDFAQALIKAGAAVGILTPKIFTEDADPIPEGLETTEAPEAPRHATTRRGRPRG
jgi:hypothetical protein